MRWICIVLFLVTSCTAKSPEYYLTQGRSLNQALLAEIQGIDDLDALIEALPRLQKLFVEQVDLIIEARKWKIRHNSTLSLNAWILTEEDMAVSQQLKIEMARLYQMPSARVLVEKSQETALLKLDSFEKSQIKKMNKLN